MKKLFAVFTFMALGSASVFAEEWTGVISDTMCGAKHLDASAASQACAQKCVKGGSAPVFVTSDSKVITLDADSAKKAMPHVGHKVTVSGTMKGDTLMIESIKM